MERAHLESEIQQVPPPLLGHPSAGVLSSCGWGVDSPARRESVSPFPTDPVEPGSTPASWGQAEERRASEVYRERQVENSAPAYIRRSESIPSLPSTPACRHAYARPFSPEDGYRNSLPAARLPRDLRLRGRRQA